MERSTRRASPSAFPSTALSYEFLFCVLSVQRKQKKRRVRKGTEEIGREEEYDGVLWKGPRAGSHPPFPSTALSYEFLSCVLSVQRKQNKRRERQKLSPTF